MRLNHYLAKAGIASRRESDRLIQEGTTTVNGVLTIDPAFTVQEKDVVIFNGKKVTPFKKTVVIALNKPKNYITTVKDTHDRKTVMDLIPVNMRLFPVGRLDRQSTGLLLLTNDGNLAQALMKPKNKVIRTYELEIDSILKPLELERVKRGVNIGWGQIGKATIMKQEYGKGKVNLVLQLTQGKNREIRRIMHALKRQVLSLHRTNYGTVSVKGIAMGTWRELTSSEIKSLQKDCHLLS